VIPALYAGNFDLLMTSLTTPMSAREGGSRYPTTRRRRKCGPRFDAETIKGLNERPTVLGVKLGSAGDTMKAKLKEALKSVHGRGIRGGEDYDDHRCFIIALAQGSVDMAS